jgi:hypothetical protein
MRTERLELRVERRDLEMVRELAGADGLSASSVVRQLVRHAHEKRFGAQRAKRERRT